MRTEIRDFRKSKGWSQEQLAQRLMVRQATISKLERGTYGISKTIAVRLHRLDPEYFSLERLLTENVITINKRNTLHSLEETMHQN